MTMRFPMAAMVASRLGSRARRRAMVRCNAGLWIDRRVWRTGGHVWVPQPGPPAVCGQGGGVIRPLPAVMLLGSIGFVAVLGSWSKLNQLTSRPVAMAMVALSGVAGGLSW